MKPTMKRLVDAAEKVLVECQGCPCDATCEPLGCPWWELRKAIDDVNAKDSAASPETPTQIATELGASMHRERYSL